jgi:hypothetical protein
MSEALVGRFVVATGIPGAPIRKVERVVLCALLSDGRPGYKGGIAWEYWPVESLELPVSASPREPE